MIYAILYLFFGLIAGIIQLRLDYADWGCKKVEWFPAVMAILLWPFWIVVHLAELSWPFTNRAATWFLYRILLRGVKPYES